MDEFYYDRLDCDDNEPRKIGICEECNEDIYDDNEEIYIDEDGNYFDCLECALRYYGIRKTEDCLVLRRG